MADPPITGLFGGTFDPVHNGHLTIVRALLQLGQVDQIIVIPAAVPPHKKDRQITSSEHRLAMLRLALADEPHCQVSDYELTRGGLSYTIDTVDHFLRDYNSSLRLIIGMDSLHDLHKWYRAKELVSRCPLLIYARPGYPPADTAALSSAFGPTQARQLTDGIVATELSPISSTAVREAVQHGKDAQALVPAPVWQYIQAKRLYQA